MLASLRSAVSATRSGVAVPYIRAVQSVSTTPRRYATSFPPYLLNTPPTKVTKLGNGLKVATEETASETATIGVFIDAGSAYESESTNGAAHFLEHMAFKGTNSRSRHALELEVENMGATLNAYTSREQTVYYAKVFKNDVDKAVNLLADIVQHSKLENTYVEAERATILREMKEVSKDYAEVIFDYLHAAAYQGTPLGRTILGPKENVERLSRDDLQAYTKAHYTAPRIVVAGAGAVKHESLVGLAEQAFGGLSTQVSEMDESSVRFTGSQITHRDDTMPIAHVAIAVESVGWSHPDYYAFLLLQTLLGAWDRSIGGGKNLASRLCESVAQENLAHSVTAFNTTYKHTGLFGVYLTAEDAQTEDAVYAVLNEWNRLGKNISNDELERAKNKLKASALMALDGTTAHCEDIGRQLLSLGRRLSPAEIFLRIDAVTTKDMIRVLRKHCEDVDPAVAAIGPLHNFPDYNQIRGWTYWNRI